MMTIAELSEHAVNHGNRLVALEQSASHTKERVGETAQSLKELNTKLDRLGWGLVGVLGTVVVQLLLALLKK